VELVAVDIGGTHARFAIADVDHGRVTNLGDATTLRTDMHASLQTAWEAFGELLGRTLPRATAIAVACPVVGDVLKLTNNPWIVRTAQIGDRLSVDAERATYFIGFALLLAFIAWISYFDIQRLGGGS
jgi:glucokinase